MNLDYYYGQEAEQFSFYRIPRVMFTEPSYKELSCEAKILYGLLLDRMGLSMKNNWVDKENRVYIYFTVEDAMDCLNCNTGKIVKVFAELDVVKGIGLIERVKQGMGRPAKIYVKNFMTKNSYGEPTKINVITNNDSINQNVGIEYENEIGNTQNNCTENILENSKAKNYSVAFKKNNTVAVKKYVKDIQKEIASNKDFETPNIASHDLRKSQFMTCDKQNSRLAKIEIQDLRKSQGNYTDINNKDIIYTDVKNPINPINPINHSPIVQTKNIFPKSQVIKPQNQKEIDGMDRYNKYKDIFCKNIDYEALCFDYGNEQIDEIVKIALDAIISTNPTIRVCSNDMPTELVKSCLLKLNMMHIEYVLECINKNTTEIKNIKNYILTSLYNSQSTKSSYFTTLVHHNHPELAGWLNKKQY